jgi:hypothetical protein
VDFLLFGPIMRQGAVRETSRGAWASGPHYIHSLSRLRKPEISQEPTSLMIPQNGHLLYVFGKYIGLLSRIVYYSSFCVAAILTLAVASSFS